MHYVWFVIFMKNTVYLIQSCKKNKNESLVQIIGLLNKVCYDKIIFLKHCL